MGTDTADHGRRIAEKERWSFLAEGGRRSCLGQCGRRTVSLKYAEDDMAAWETVDYPTFIVGSAVEHAQQARLTQALEEQER